jgi:hypothetical protein
MSEQLFTVGSVAQCLGIHERVARKLLNDAGATPRLDEYDENPSEPVSRTLVIDLVAVRAGDRVGRKLAELLRA